MSTKATHAKKWAVDIIESERGWGSKVDETIHFDSKEEAEKYVKDYNTKYNSKSTVPDWYMYAAAPREEFVEV